MRDELVIRRALIEARRDMYQYAEEAVSFNETLLKEEESKLKLEK